MRARVFTGMMAVLLLTVPCLGLTTVTVNPGGGADQTSLSAAEAALPNPLTDDYRISCAGATDDTTAAVIDVETLNGETQYTLEIVGDWSGGAFDDSKYHLNVGAGATALTVNAHHVTFRNLQVSGTLLSTYSIHGFNIGGNFSNITVHDCIIRNFIRTGSNCGINVGGGTGTAKVFYNNVISNCSQGMYLRQNSNADVYNSTIVNCLVRGLWYERANAKTFIFKNNLITGSGTSDWDEDLTGGTVTTAKNYTGDITSPDAGCASATITFAAAADFHLAEAMRGTLAGVDLSVTFTTDIDAETRDTWYAGADEMTPASGPTIQQQWWARRRQ